MAIAAEPTSSAIGAYAVPSGWTVATIGELFDIQQGKALSPRVRTATHRFPFLRTANVLWGKLDLTVVDQMGLSSDERERLRLKPRDLLVCEGGEIGRAALWTGKLDECYYQNHIHRLRPRDTRAFPEFYMYWLQLAFTRLQVYEGAGTKTTIANLSQGRLARLEVPVPPVDEQRRIASSLGAIQAAAEVANRQGETKRMLKRVLAARLFSEGIADGSVRGLKETPIGWIPEPWSVLPVGDLMAAPMRNGIFVRQPRWGSGTKYLNVVNVYDATSVNVAMLESMQLPNDLPEDSFLSDGDIVFVRSSLKREGIAKACVLIDPSVRVAYDCHLIRARPDTSRINPVFLAEYCRSDLGHLRLIRLSKTTTMTTIPQANLAGFLVPVPPLKEQEAIATTLATLDASSLAQMHKIAALAQLFASALNTLMAAA